MASGESMAPRGGGEATHGDDAEPTSDARAAAAGSEATVSEAPASERSTAPQGGDGESRRADEESRAAPAAEPSGSEPAAGEPSGSSEPSVEELLRRYLSLPPIRVTAPPPPDPLVDRSASTVPAPARTPSLASVDQKLAQVEPLLAVGDWDGVIEALAREETLPPPLALLYAIALKERAAEGDPQGLAIRSVAALLCVPENSETALVVAKRLLRTNPVAWRQRPAPSARVSIGIVLCVAVLGALIGFLAGPGAPLLR